MNTESTFISNAILLLLWFTLVCSVFGLAALIEHILLDRISLIHKCLDSKHYH